VQRDGHDVVFVLDERNVAKSVDVGTPRKLGDVVAVAGVKAGDRVVVSPPAGLRDGTAVDIAKK